MSRLNKGIARNLSSTLKDDAYAFIFDQQGLMASLSTKISRIKPTSIEPGQDSGAAA
ncbi:MAG: hypothetical protein ACYCZR_08485 [Burkholderiales bacterium]